MCKSGRRRCQLLPEHQAGRLQLSCQSWPSGDTPCIGDTLEVCEMIQLQSCWLVERKESQFSLLGLSFWSLVTSHVVTRMICGTVRPKAPAWILYFSLQRVHGDDVISKQQMNSNMEDKDGEKGWKVREEKYFSIKPLSTISLIPQ